MYTIKVKKFFKAVILWMMAGIIFAPVFLVVSGSIKGNGELKELLAPILMDTDRMLHWRIMPCYPTLMHFVTLLLYRPQFFTLFWNSIKITGWILLGQSVVSMPAAWGFTRYATGVTEVIYKFYIIFMLLPFQVMMLPSYLYLNRLGLINTHAAIILPAVFSTFPVFLICHSFQEIPEGMLESARIDGANEWQLFFHIGIPLGSSGILCAMTLGFLEYWNLIEQPLAFLKDKSLWPLSLYLPEINLNEAGIALAASVVTLIPAVFVFIVGQDYLEMGIAASGMKE